MWNIDGANWTLPCDVSRSAKIQSSDISGTLLDKSYFNDVLGTYMQYNITVAVPFGMEQEYNELYEIITAPVDGHEFILPYAGGNIAITGRVEEIRDDYVETDSGIHWRGIRFNVIANHPSKSMDLDEVITRGVTPLPDESDIDVGSAYVYETNGWELMARAEDSSY